MIATKEDKEILMDCEDKEGLTYLEIHKGNNMLKAKSNCLFKEEGMNPQFAFRTPANQEDILFEVQHLEATFIDPNKPQLEADIQYENSSLNDLNKLEIEAEEKGFVDNAMGACLMEVISRMNTSNKHSREANKKIEEKLHHKNIWDYGT